MSDILDPNPFAKSVMAAEGNATAREIYTSVGFALDRWEHCDTSFAVMYSALVCHPHDGTHVLMRAFGMINSPSTRHGMIVEANDAVFAQHPEHSLRKKVRSLLHLYQDAAARRNEIVHSMVMGESRAKVVNNVAIPLPTVWFLVPPLFATRKNEMHLAGPKYRYSTNEIDHFSACYETLSVRVMEVTQQIRGFVCERLSSP